MFPELCSQCSWTLARPIQDPYWPSVAQPTFEHPLWWIVSMEQHGTHQTLPVAGLEEASVAVLAVSKEIRYRAFSD